MTHPLLSRELKYVIQRFAEDPRQEVSLFLFYFFLQKEKEFGDLPGLLAEAVLSLDP